MRPLPIAAVAVAVAGTGTVVRYRRDLARARRRLERVDRRVVDTGFGPVEYVDRGSGHALLVSHGIFHGCDGGLLSVRDVVDDRRIIVPSRFGYLGSARPADAAADTQADAFAALLDHLGLDDVDVLAVSAGTSAAIQLALRHPERVRRLVLSSGNFPGSATAQAPPDWATTFYSDRVMWTLRTFARPMFARLMGVPDGFPRDADQAHVVEELLDSIFPIGPRIDGAVFDAFVSNPDVVTYPLEDLRTPTLIVHATDDPLASYAAAVAASERIPHAVLVGLESGGHLQLGQSQRVHDEITAFLT